MRRMILFTLLLGMSLAACAETQESAVPKEISVDKAYELYNNGILFLDVRSQEEWNGFHAPNSTLIPLDQLQARLDELPKDQLIVVVCRSGNRSAQGRDILLGAGFTQVTSMAGGLGEWSESGYPIASGPK